jgi:hypothetical protein
VGGVMLPFVIRTSDDAPWDTSVRTFTSITHDGPVDDAVFAMPKPPAQAALAGERYKSVRILTNVPAAAIIPTMAFISNSLGVTCAHCHTDVYESDDKPMKNKARQMIQMTRAINDTHFAGRTVMTCETCHGGQAVPVHTPVVENSGWNKRAATVDALPLPTVDSVLRRYQSAIGIETLTALRSQKVTGTITRNNGRTVPASDAFELFQERPGTVRLSTPLSHPPEADVELPMTFLRPPLLSKAYAELRVVGRAAIPDAAIMVEGQSARGGVHRMYFSDETGLLVRRTDEIDTPLGRLPENYDFSDFRRIGGVAIPMRIVWSRADYQVTFALSDVQHDSQAPKF